MTKEVLISITGIHTDIIEKGEEVMNQLQSLLLLTISEKRKTLHPL